MIFVQFCNQHRNTDRVKRSDVGQAQHSIAAAATCESMQLFAQRQCWTVAVVVGVLTLLTCNVVVAQPLQPIPYQPNPSQPFPQQPQPGISAESTIQEFSRLYPLCFVLGEQLVDSYIRQVNCDEGPIDDLIMGAQVRGFQKTEARTSLDFVPNAEVARIVVLLNGVTTNQTAIQTQQATIHSEGSHQFRLTKQLEFDGQVIRTWSPAAYMTIHQRHLGASTRMEGIPLLGPLANAAALSAAQQRSPQSQRIAAWKITQQVAPRFNNELDEEISELNKLLETRARPKLAERGFAPDVVKTQSTHDAVLIGLSFGGSGSHPGFQPPVFESPMRVPSGAPVLPESLPAEPIPAIPPQRPSLPSPGPLQIEPISHSQNVGFSLNGVPYANRLMGIAHDSLVSQLVSRSALPGLELTDNALNKLIKPEEATGNPSEAQLYTLIFSKEQPLTARFDGEEALLDLQFSIRPKLGADVPEHRVTIAIIPELTNDEIRLRFETRDIQAVDPAAENPLAGAITQVIRQAFDQNLKDRTFPRSYQWPHGGEGKTVPARIQELHLQNGWLTLAFELTVPEPTTVRSDMPLNGPVPTPAQIPTPIPVQPQPTPSPMKGPLLVP